MVLVLCMVLAWSDAGQIDLLIRQLGSSQFAEREAASRRLEAIGETALEALRKAAKSNDVEVRRRAEQVIEAIEAKDYDRLEGSWEGTADWSPRLEVRGGKFTFITRVRDSFSFSLVPTNAPKAIDFYKQRRSVLLGIYAVKGDELQICIPTQDNLKRPDAFAKGEDPTCITLKFKRLRK
jgi:uncharacterized protein (TIGR03067 family)